MTKQKEIREVLKQIEFTKQEKLLGGLAFELFKLDGGTEEYWDTDSKDGIEYLHRAYLLLQFEDSQGVVLKVEGELPHHHYPRPSISNATQQNLSYKDRVTSYAKALEDMLKAGYVAVESLILGGKE